MYDSEFNTSTYYILLKQLEAKFEIIKIDTNKYITKKKLNEIGISDEMINSFIRLVKNNVGINDFFTIDSLKEILESTEIYKYGFEDIFYESILISTNEIKAVKFQNKMIMIFSEQQNIKQNDVIINLLKKQKGYIIDDLVDLFNKKYGININKSKILEICYESNLYYNKELEKIYLNKDQWYEEVY